MDDGIHRPRLLVVDDDDGFRLPLVERLALRGFEVQEASGGEAAVRLVRADPDLDVVILDHNMPDMDGTAVLEQLKIYRPEIQVIMLTGFGSVDSALTMGRMGVVCYLNKPVPIDDLVKAIRKAARQKVFARAHLDLPARRPGSLRGRLVGSHNLRPAIILLGLAILLTGALLTPPEALVSLVSAGKNPDLVRDPVGGYPHYGAMDPGETIADHYVATSGPPGVAPGDAGATARRALIMIALILTAVVFWATGAVPLGITALLVAVVMYAGGIMRPDGIAQAFAKDAVVFIFGVLVLSRVVISTGLDRRLAMLLLMPVRSLARLYYVFLPLFAVACSFISESILIALMMPVFVAVFRHARGADGLPLDPVDNRAMLVMFALMLCYASNLGGPGSPAAGGRNAVMVGILADYQMAPSFLQWMTYGLPFVPVAGVVTGLYFHLAFRRRIRTDRLDVAAFARADSDRLGPMTREEKTTAVVGLAVVALWIFGSGRLGMGGPVLLGLVVLNIAGVMKWGEVTKIHWDVVFLYAGASALGKGLVVTGAALFLARGFVDGLPPSLLDGTALGGLLGRAGLPIAVSLLTGLVTNIMSDGAAVAAVGPIAVPMAQAAGLHPWAVGFATAFASSFPHMLIIGTPANALVYILCRDPVTGRQLVTQADFLRHGAAVFVLSFLVLWVWAILGYWRWLGL